MSCFVHARLSRIKNSHLYSFLTKKRINFHHNLFRPLFPCLFLRRFEIDGCFINNWLLRGIYSRASGRIMRLSLGLLTLCERLCTPLHTGSGRLKNFRKIVQKNSKIEHFMSNLEFLIKSDFFFQKWNFFIRMGPLCTT